MITKSPVPDTPPHCVLRGNIVKDFRDLGRSTDYHVHEEDIENVLAGDTVRLQCKAVDRALSLAHPPEHGRILVQGCGTGAEGVYLAKLGYEVVGVDISEHQRRVAQMRFEREGVCFQYVVADMTEAPFRSGTFDQVINMNIAFGFFGTEETDQQVLTEAQRLLKRRGKFFGEFINRDHALSHPKDCHDCGQFDIQTGLFSDMRLYTEDEWKQLIENAGLKLAGAWGGGDWDLSILPLTRDAYYILLLAFKP